MRVIGGQWRGRTLHAPASRTTRPTSDRVREAIFDVLGSILGPGGLAGLDVADLFAGSGALGLEALSRGAAHAVLVDHDPRAVATIRRNLAALDAPAEVVRADVLSWLATAAAARGFSIAFVDPPYAFDRWPALLDRLQANLVVAESDRPVAVPTAWQVQTVKRYGGTLVTVATSPAAPIGRRQLDASAPVTVPGRVGPSGPRQPSEQRGAP
jgi:16S rRNA (guanine966-N2)-methyltransferase